ncbi:MAG: hypothetical protein ACI8P0_002770 [Planctomycetaceae bacterium]|jgi:hypothetical protein
MIAEPIPDTEYTLVRTVDAQLHVATFIRYPDNSGSIRHGGYGESWEFNWAGLLDSWRALRGAGWITLEEAIGNCDLATNASPTCDCPYFDANKLFELMDAGLPIDEVNRQWKEYCRPIIEFHDHILWGG